MDWTRRQFLLTAGLLAPAATAALRTTVAATAELMPYDDPAYLIGDPYLAAIAEPGLGGRSFGAARERALRFRASAAERDRRLFGLDAQPGEEDRDA